MIFLINYRFTTSYFGSLNQTNKEWKVTGPESKRSPFLFMQKIFLEVMETFCDLSGSLC